MLGNLSVPGVLQPFSSGRPTNLDAGPRSAIGRAPDS